jgi:hypothetical protein
VSLGEVESKGALDTKTVGRFGQADNTPIA